MPVQSTVFAKLCSVNGKSLVKVLMMKCLWSISIVGVALLLSTSIIAQSEEEDCYIGDGSSYRGTVAVAHNGDLCINWSIGDYNEERYPNKGLGDHNYCRNPDEDSKPWCLTLTETDWEYCDIARCNGSDITNHTTVFPVFNGYGNIVRLVRGQTEYDGHVEVYKDGVWSRICDDGWDTRDAQVVCRQLGYGEVREVLNLEYSCEDDISTFFTDLDCNGGEQSLSDCLVDINDWSYRQDNECPTSRDAGVRCEGVTCNMDILQNVKDFQFSASSQYDKYSPQHSRIGFTDFGWCADPNDYTPFVEVDLLIPMTIVGLCVRGWLECPRAASENTTFKGVAMFNVTMENGSSIHDDEWEQLSREEFTMDTSLDVTETQCFNTTEHITARYIRIYPLQAWEENICLTFSLIGCLKDAFMIDFFCNDNSKDAGVVKVERGLAYTVPEPFCDKINETSSECERNCTAGLSLSRSRSKCPETYPVNDSVECQSLCNKDPSCNMAKFDIMDSVCYVHNNEFDELTMVADATTDQIIYQRLCMTDRNFKLVIDGTMTTTNPVTIYNPGYPLPVKVQPVQETFYWTFDFRNIERYPMLMFDDLQFEEPAHTKNIHFVFGGTDWLSLFGEAKISKPTLISPGLTLCHLCIWYKNTTEALHHGFSFRAIVASSDLPDAELSKHVTLISKWEILDAFINSGMVISRSFIGIYHKEFTNYVIRAYSPELYTELAITSFYVSCRTNQDTSFTIQTDDSSLNFCNLQRPWKRLTFLPNSDVKLQFAFNYKSEVRPIDGFTSEYRISPYMEEMSKIAVLEEETQVPRPRNVYRFGAVDVALLVDVTYHFHANAAKYMDKFLWKVISDFSQNDTQFALISFADEAIVHYTLNENWNKTDMENILRQHAGRFGTRRCFSCALDMIRNTIYTEENGDRPTAPNVVLALLYDSPSYPAHSESEITEAQSDGIYLHIIDITSYTQRLEFQWIGLVAETKGTCDVENCAVYNVHTVHTLKVSSQSRCNASNMPNGRTYSASTIYDGTATYLPRIDYMKQILRTGNERLTIHL